jgi:acetyl-CoA synthetase
MPWDAIRKTTGNNGAMLRDYDATRASFDWTAARGELSGLPGGGLNIAHEAVDRHVIAGRGDTVAMRFIGLDGARTEFTYAALAEETARFADVLRQLGVGKGDRVFSLLGRRPELYVTALGTLRNGSVFCPMFSAFGPDPVRDRMTIGDAKVLVTTTALYKRKVAAWAGALATLDHVLLVDGNAESVGGGDRVHDYHQLMRQAAGDLTIAHTQPEDMALLHFTSGTTGKPKGAVHVHDAVLAHMITGRWALDLRPGDVFWCTADPGWVTGTSYGIVAPLTNGVTLIVDQAEFDAERWYGILQDEKVTVWCTAPTAIRMLMKLGAEVARTYDLSSLRFMASVGEPLNPEAVVWGNETFGRPFHDNWWQTETGGIMIANYASMDVKPGSMGRPLPGIEAAVVTVNAEGVHPVDAPMTPGELALKPGWPSMMRAYLHNPERYAKAFRDGWYLSGDLAMRDADGYFWFLGRADDMIKSAGHLIGPFEVESALMEHPAVAEVGVIGVPDERAGEVVKAFVALKAGFAADEALNRALIGHARKRLGPALAPRAIAFRDNLPKTQSEKIMRRLLKARELGLPEGDLSTLESDER